MFHPFQNAIVQAIWWGRLLVLCWCLQQIYCLSNLCQLQQNKEDVSMLNDKSFPIYKKCFSTSQSFKSSNILYFSIHLLLFSIHTYICSQDRCTVLPHITQSKYLTFGDKPKRLLNFFLIFWGNSTVSFWERIGMKGKSQKFLSH